MGLELLSFVVVSLNYSGKNVPKEHIAAIRSHVAKATRCKQRSAEDTQSGYK